MAALDLARLKLRCAYKTEGDLDWDSDNLTPRQEELLMGSYRVRPPSLPRSSLGRSYSRFSET